MGIKPNHEREDNGYNTQPLLGIYRGCNRIYNQPSDMLVCLKMTQKNNICSERKIMTNPSPRIIIRNQSNGAWLVAILAISSFQSTLWFCKTISRDLLSTGWCVYLNLPRIAMKSYAARNALPAHINKHFLTGVAWTRKTEQACNHQEESVAGSSSTQISEWVYVAKGPLTFVGI